jgi:hypothetical protein
MTNEVKVKVTADNKDFKKGLKDSSKAVDKASKSMIKSFSKVDIAIGGLAGNLAADTFRNILGKARDLFNFMGKDAVAAAQVQEDAVNQLNIALKNTGQFSQETSQNFQDYASSLQGMTRFGDEVILQNAALIQSLGNLSQDGLKGATKAALDMSAALGIDLTSAATLVGKAAAGEIGSFSRFGVIIEKGADKAETFANALTALNRQFGGAAAGQIKTYSGATEQMSNTIGDFQEKIGEIVTKNPLVIKAIKVINQVFLDLQQVVEDNKRELGLFIGLVADVFIKAVKVAAKAAEGIIKTLGGFSEAIHGIRLAYAELTNKSIEDGLTGQIDTLRMLREELEKNEKAMKAINERAARRNRDHTKQELAQLASISRANKKLRSEIIEAELAIMDTENRLIEERKARTDSDTSGGKSSKVKAKEKENEELLKLDEELRVTREEIRLLEEEEALLRQEERFIKLSETLDAEEALRQTAREKALVNMKASEDLINKTKKDGDKKALDAHIKNIKIRKQWDELSSKEKIKLTEQTFGELANLMKVAGKENNAAFQAAAIAQAIMAGILSVQQALTLPFPFGEITAAIRAATTAANVAKIAGVKFAQGGIVPGSSYSGDQVPARVNSGEMILNRSQQSNLFSMIDNDRGGQSGTVINITGNVIANDDTEVDSLIERINDRLEFGNATLSV